MKNNKSLGQHWLKNRTILDEIANLAAVEANEETICLEIGPGLGTLTSSLLKHFSKVVAVEYDSRLAENLPKSFPGKNLEIINADILKVDVSALIKSDNYVAVGNIPYYITSPIVNLLISSTPRPRRIVLLMQKEVAERITAKADKYSLIALAVQNQAEVELGPVVKAAEFTPPPKVDSQVLVLTPLDTPQVDPTVLELAKQGFSNPRKKLSANLANTQLGISKTSWEDLLRNCTINPDARAEDLGLWDWEELYRQVQKISTTNEI